MFFLFIISTVICIPYKKILYLCHCDRKHNLLSVPTLGNYQFINTRCKSHVSILRQLIYFDVPSSLACQSLLVLQRKEYKMVTLANPNTIYIDLMQTPLSSLCFQSFMFVLVDVTLFCSQLGFDTFLWVDLSHQKFKEDPWFFLHLCIPLTTFTATSTLHRLFNNSTLQIS